MSDIQLLSYPVSEVEPYIHWLYFFHAWGFPPRFATITSIHSCPSCRQGWISTFSDDEQSKAKEAMRLYDDACLILRQLEGKIEIRTLFFIIPDTLDQFQLLQCIRQSGSAVLHIRFCKRGSQRNALFLHTVSYTALLTKHPCLLKGDRILLLIIEFLHLCSGICHPLQQILLLRPAPSP